MDLEWLKDFLAVADRLSVSRAAAQRHVTQSTMSRRLRALEEWVGAPLIARQTHRLALTAAGERFAATATDLVGRLELGRQEARAIAERSTSALRIASTHALSITFFPGWLRALEEAAPVGVLRLTADTMAGCERLMLGGEAQFLLCHRHAAVPDMLSDNGFRSLVLGRDVLVPVSSPNASGHALHPLGGDGTQSAALLAYGEASGIGRILAASHRAAPALHADIRFTSHLAMVLRAMALAGNGVAFLPRGIVASDLEAGTLVRAADAVWDIEVDICLTRSRARQSAAAERFWSRLQDGSHPAP